MFNIFVKRPSIVLDCFVSNPAIYEQYPVTLASELSPTWLKSLKPTITNISEHGVKHEQGTIKRCDGLIGLNKVGCFMPLWSDLIIETNEHGAYSYLYSSSENLPISCHGREQLGTHFDDLIHIKILSPWIFEEKSGVKFYFNQASWHWLYQSYKMHVLPAVIDFKNQSGTHVNTFMPRANSRLELSAGQPLVHLIPLSDKRLVVKNHLISPEEHRMKTLRFSYMSKFLGRYKYHAKKS